MAEENQTTPEKATDADDFSQAAQEAQMGFFREFADFLLHNKKWWITPIVVVLLLVAALVMLGGTAAAPFIYQLF